MCAATADLGGSGKPLERLERNFSQDIAVHNWEIDERVLLDADVAQLNSFEEVCNKKAAKAAFCFKTYYS